MSELAFYAADTLGMQIRSQGEFLFAEESRPIPFGPWTIATRIEVDSDVITPKEATFWINVGKHLWFYLIVRKYDMIMYAFDAQEVGIHGKNRKTFGGKSVEETVHQIKSAVKGTFVWEKEEWDKVDFKLPE